MIYNVIDGCWVDHLNIFCYWEKIKWCNDQFGPEQDVLKTDFTWGFRDGYIYIQDEKLATLYMLRWT